MATMRTPIALTLLLVLGSLSGCTVKIDDESFGGSTTHSSTGTTQTTSRIIINGCEVDQTPQEKDNPKPVSQKAHDFLMPATDKKWTWTVDNSTFKTFRVVLRIENPGDAPVVHDNLRWSIKGGQCVSKTNNGGSSGVAVSSQASGVVLDYKGEGVRSVGAWTLSLTSTAAVAFYDVDIEVTY